MHEAGRRACADSAVCEKYVNPLLDISTWMCSANDSIGYAVIYTCEVQHAGEVAAQFEIASGDMCIMFFWRGKHVKCDLGTGDNEKTTWVVGKQEMIDIVEVVCRGARKGRGQVDGPRDYATRGRW